MAYYVLIGVTLLMLLLSLVLSLFQKKMDHQCNNDVLKEKEEKEEKEVSKPVIDETIEII